MTAKAQEEAVVLEACGLGVALQRGGESQPLLRDISFALRARQILGVIGASGAGKTLLAKALVHGLAPPLAIDRGALLYRGEDLLRLPPARLRRVRGGEIGYIGSNPGSALDPTLPVGWQIAEKLRAVRPGVGWREARERAIELLAKVRIPAPARRFGDYPSQFSGGMLQRALIVDALIGDPAFLVADNITQPLDVTVAAQILRLLRELVEGLGTAIVFVSSSLPMLGEVADEILVLHEGTLVERQPARRLVEAPRHAFTRALVAQTPRIWQGEERVAPPRPEARPILRVTEVSKTYRVRRRGSFLGHDAVRAVHRVSFDVKAGENFGIVGESGCGKSTLTRLLTWLERPDQGDIAFDGRSLRDATAAEMTRLRRSLQLILQDPYNSLPPRSTIARIIDEPLRIHGLGDRRERRERVRAAMAEVGLPLALADELPLGLSAGQRQRIGIARAMILEPKLLILDETLSALDQAEQFRLLELFERLQQQHAFTYLFISHDMALVRRVCTRVAVMYLGEVVELAENQRLFFDPGHPYSRALLSAVPTLEARPYRSEDCLLEGEPPSPIDIPPGCSFAPRCPHAATRCRSAVPALLPRGRGNQAACFLVEAEPARSALS